MDGISSYTGLALDTTELTSPALGTTEFINHIVGTMVVITRTIGITGFIIHVAVTCNLELVYECPVVS